MTRWWSARAAGSLTLAALAALSAGVTVAAAVEARDEARAHGQRSLAAVAQRFSIGLQSSQSSLRGSNGMAADGTVTDAEFVAFSTEVVRSSNFAALAYSELVAESERAGWEAAAGHPMQDLRDGTFIVAAARPLHAVVRQVNPVDDITEPLKGWDLLGDPGRANGIQRAMRAGDAVVGPIPLASTGTPGVFLIQSVRDLDGNVIGFVSAGISLQALLGTTTAELAEVTNLRMWIDGQPALVDEPAGDDPQRVTFEVAEHTFVLEGTDRHGPGWGVASILAFCTVLLVGGLAAALWRARRDRAREEAAAVRGARLADLREILGSSTDVEHVVHTIAERAGAALGADWAGISRRDPLDSEQITIALHDAGTAASLVPETVSDDSDELLPLRQCMRAGALVSINRPTGKRHSLIAAAGSPEPRTAICAPLSLATERTVGAVGFGWNHELTSDEMEDASAAVLLIAQLAGRAIERATIRELVQERVTQLSEFTKLISAVRSTAEIEQLVEQRLPPLLDVEAASVGADIGTDGGTVRTYSAPHPLGQELQLLMSPRTEWTPTLHALAQAVVDVVHGAWTRASEQEQEHLVLQRLQASLLLPAPEVEGFEIAVSYRSAMTTVEIGGDWYSVIDRPDVVHLLVGDVAGHGPGAVAIMAESKTILRHLISDGTPMAEALEHASAALVRRHAYASVVAITIHKVTGTLTYLNAGHPAAIMDSDAGVTTLDDVHRAWLGVEDSPRPASSLPFPRGARLLLYTDGLIEDRCTPLDECVRQLAVDMAQYKDAPADLVERLINARAKDERPSVVDDDIAVIALERR